jgi:trehalose 6-phosphate phosphatase
MDGVVPARSGGRRRSVKPAELSAAGKRLEKGAPLLALLDLDGTLAAIKKDPRKVRLYPGVASTLGRLAALPNSRVVIVSGRRAAHARRIAGPAPSGIVGLHGVERIGPGRLRRVPIAARTLRALDRLFVRASRIAAGLPGLRVEDKRPGCVVLHTRGAPASVARGAEETFAAAVRAHRRDGVRLLLGKSVAEARVAGVDKGTAVRALVHEARAEARARKLPKPVVVFAGDDATDEDAHRALSRTAALTILVAGSPRATAAKIRVPSIAALRRLLEQVAWYGSPR